MESITYLSTAVSSKSFGTFACQVNNLEQCLEAFDEQSNTKIPKKCLESHAVSPIFDPASDRGAKLMTIRMNMHVLRRMVSTQKVR